MSGSMSGGGVMGELAKALMGPQIAQQAQQANSNQPQFFNGIPLGSMAGMMSPNATQLQQQNPALPWFAVPGMFQAPSQPTPAMASTMQSPSAQAGVHNAFLPSMMEGPALTPGQTALLGLSPEDEAVRLQQIQQAMSGPNVGGSSG